MFPKPKQMSMPLFPCLILSQNGSFDGLHYRPENSSAHTEVSASKDAQNGNVVSGDSSIRPNTLDVSSQGYAKNFRDHSHDQEDGSLPCTPDMQTDSKLDVSSGHAGDEVLVNDTRQLMSTFFREFTGLSKPSWCESKELATMNRVVNDLLVKHEYAFNGMLKKLKLDDNTNDMTLISEVAKNIFSDGKTNWGRIASLVAFSAVVARHLKEREDCVELVSEETCTYLLTHQRDWLVKNNSWEGFVEFFRVSDPESTVRKTLMAFAGVAGIGATLALLIR